MATSVCESCQDALPIPIILQILSPVLVEGGRGGKRCRVHTDRQRSGGGERGRGGEDLGRKGQERQEVGMYLPRVLPSRFKTEGSRGGYKMPGQCPVLAQ